MSLHLHLTCKMKGVRTVYYRVVRKVVLLLLLVRVVLVYRGREAKRREKKRSHPLTPLRLLLVVAGWVGE